MATVSEFTRSIDPGIQAVFMDELSRASFADQLLNLVDARSRTMTFGAITGAAATPIKVEGDNAQAFSPRQAGQVSATHVVYSHLLEITREMQRWDLKDTIMRLVRAMAQGAPYTMEYSAANLLNRAFNSSYTGADGIELVSRVHTLYGPAGGTTPNEIATTATALSTDTLEEARLIHQNQPNDDGLILQQRPRFLVTGLTLGTRARKMLLSEKEWDTANNAVNAIARGIMPIEIDLISSTTSYFLLSDKSQTGLMRSLAQAPTPRGPWRHEESESDRYGLSMEFVDFFIGWRGVTGAEGV